MFGLYCALTILSPRRSLSVPAIAASGIVSSVALLVNPYGWHMLEFIATTVGLDRSDINDWQPLWRSGLPAGLVGGFCRRGGLRRVSPVAIVTPLAGCHRLDAGSGFASRVASRCVFRNRGGLAPGTAPRRRAPDDNRSATASGTTHRRSRDSAGHRRWIRSQFNRSRALDWTFRGLPSGRLGRSSRRIGSRAGSSHGLTGASM